MIYDTFTFKHMWDYHCWHIAMYLAFYIQLYMHKNDSLVGNLESIIRDNIQEHTIANNVIPP